MYNLEEYTNKINEIKSNITDESKVTAVLADLLQDYSDTVLKYDESIKSNEELNKNNENLRQSNMELFLKIGEQNKNLNLDNNNNNNNNNNDDDDTLSFDKLFNDKGELI